MTFLQFFTSIIGRIWSGMSSITVPLLNISVTSFLLGIFIVCVAIQILNPLLGIGASVVDSFVVGAHRSNSRASARSSARSSARYRAGRAADANLRDVSRWV